MYFITIYLTNQLYFGSFSGMKIQFGFCVNQNMVCFGMVLNTNRNNPAFSMHMSGITGNKNNYMYISILQLH